MIEASIYGLSIINNFRGMIRGLNPLKFVLLVQGALDSSNSNEPWLSSWWGYSLALLKVLYWFEEENIGDDLIWVTTPVVMDTALYLLLESRLQ